MCYYHHLTREPPGGVQGRVPCPKSCSPEATLGLNQALTSPCTPRPVKARSPLLCPAHLTARQLQAAPPHPAAPR